jgi:hypothetical protein
MEMAVGIVLVVLSLVIIGVIVQTVQANTRT